MSAFISQKPSKSSDESTDDEEMSKGPQASSIASATQSLEEMALSKREEELDDSTTTLSENSKKARDLPLSSKKVVVKKHKEAASSFDKIQNARRGRKFRGYQQENWVSKVKEIKEFRFLKGHCKIPHDLPSNNALSRWAKRQRYQYCLYQEGRPSSLTIERIEELEDLGFVWDLQELSWNENFDELRRFAMMKGHANVPSEWPNNRSLGKWVKCQRRQHKIWKQDKHSSMTQDRVARLEAVGFQWVILQNQTRSKPKIQYISPWHVPIDELLDIVV